MKDLYRKKNRHLTEKKAFDSIKSAAGKKFSGLVPAFYSILLIISGPFLFSCSFNSSDSKSSQSPETQPETYGYVTFESIYLPGHPLEDFVQDQDERQVAVSPSKVTKNSLMSRDIVPAMEISSLTSFNFSGKVKNAAGIYGEEKEICLADSFSELNTKASNHEIMLRTGNWNLSLSADYQGITYKGSQEAVIQENEYTSLSFLLTPVLEDGVSYYGGVLLNVKFKGEARKALLTLKSEDETLTYIENQELEITSLVSDPGEECNGKVTFQRNLLSESERLEAGTYFLQIAFFGDAGGATPLNTYSEFLVVSPALTSAENRTIMLNEAFTINYYVDTLEVRNYSDITFASSAPSAYSIRSSFNLPALVRDEFDFKEWRLDSPDGSVISRIDASVIRSKINGEGKGKGRDIKLYAVWNSVPYAKVLIKNGDLVQNQFHVAVKDQIINVLNGYYPDGTNSISAFELADIEIYFYAQASLEDIGSSYDSSFIAGAIRETGANSVKVDMTEAMKMTSTSTSIFNFEECQKLVEVKTSALSQAAIQENFCKNCSSLKKVTIYSANTSIPNNAFAGCGRLKDVVFVDVDNSRITSIGENAFEDCSELGSLEIPPLLEEISNNAFKNCENLQGLSFPESLTRIGNNAFAGCYVLANLDFEDSLHIWELKSWDQHVGYMRVHDPERNAYKLSRVYNSEVNWSYDVELLKTDKTEVSLSLKPGNILNELLHSFDGGETKISFEPSLTFPEEGGSEPDENDVKNLDDLDEGFVKAWASGNKIYYYSKEYALNGTKIKACPNSENIFASFTDIQKIDLSPIDFSEVYTFNGLFYNCQSLNNLILPSSMQTPKLENMSSMFTKCSSLTSLTFPSDFDFSKVTNMSNAFEEDSRLESITFPASMDTTSLNSMENTFKDCVKLRSLDLMGFDTANVENMSNLCKNCSDLESVTISSTFTASKLVYASSMFYGCSKLNSIDLTYFSNDPYEFALYNISQMFYGCTGLTSVTLPSYLRIYNDSTDEEMGISSLFYNCIQLATINNLDKLDVEGTRNLSQVFYNCQSLTSLDISSFKIGGSGVSNVNLEKFLAGCSSLYNLTLPDNIGYSSYPVQMNQTFAGCSSLTDLSFLANSTIYAKEKLEGLFKDCTGLTKAVFPKTFHVEKASSPEQETKEIFKGCTNLAYADISSLKLDDSRGAEDKNLYRFDGTSNIQTLVVGPETRLSYSLFAPASGSAICGLVGQVGSRKDAEDISFYKTDNAEAQGYFTSEYSVFVSGSDVMPIGNDTSGDGTKDKPFASIAKAVESINARITAGEDPSGGESTATTESRSYFTPGWSIIVKGNIITNVELTELKASSLLIQGTAYGSSTNDHGGDACILSGNNNGRIITVNENTQATVKSPLTFKNIKITQGRIADSKGGALYINHPDCEVNFATGTQVTDNFAQSGGAIFSKSDVNVYANTLFSGNSTDTASTSCGGVFYITDSAKLIINGGIFNNNSSPRGGVLINGNNTQVEIKGGSFDQNQALSVSGNSSSGCGGVAYVLGSFTVSGGEFGGDSTGNSAVNGGVLYGSSNSVINITGGSLHGNTATEAGGAIMSASSVTMTGGSIYGNTSGTTGGGLTVGGNDGKAFSFGGGSIYSNKSNGMGGGIYATGPVYMYGSAVLGNQEASSTAKSSGNSYSNYAGTKGGGLYIKIDGSVHFGKKLASDGLSLEEAPLTGGIYYNYATQNGGGIYAESLSSLTIASGNISYNYAGSNGGAIYNASSGTIRMSSGSISNNGSLYNGAGIRLGGSGDSFIMEGGTISGNKTGNNNAAGGGIYGGSESSSISISGGSISENTAQFGGGIYNKTCSLSISGGTISGNSATADLGTGYIGGGAICVEGLFYISGNPSIPVGTNSKNDIYLTAKNALTLEPYPVIIQGNLDSSIAAKSIYLNPSLYKVGFTVLHAEPTSLVSDNYTKFQLSNFSQAWFISNEGKIDIAPVEGFTISAPTYNSSGIKYINIINNTDDGGSIISKTFKIQGDTSYLTNIVWIIDDNYYSTGTVAEYTVLVSLLGSGNHNVKVICKDPGGFYVEGSKSFYIE